MYYSSNILEVKLRPGGGFKKKKKKQKLYRKSFKISTIKTWLSGFRLQVIFFLLFPIGLHLFAMLELSSDSAFRDMTAIFEAADRLAEGGGGGGGDGGGVGGVDFDGLLLIDHFVMGEQI